MSILGKIFGVFIICIVLLFITAIGFGIYDTYKFERNRECFEKIAIEECDKRGLVFATAYQGMNRILFECKEYERETESRKFIFLKEEKEECLK